MPCIRQKLFNLLSIIIEINTQAKASSMSGGKSEPQRQIYMKLEITEKHIQIFEHMSQMYARIMTATAAAAA